MKKITQKSKQNWLFVCCAGICALSFSSCSFQPKKVSANELSATYQRQTAQTGEVTDDFQNALAQFSIDLLQKTITQDSKNDLVSPLSAMQCLSLIANGANGETLSQLENLLGGIPIDAFNQASYAYVSSLYSADDCQVNLANSIWFKENAINVLPDFLQTNADWYGAQAYAAPFNQKTLTDVNNWCYNHTKGKISKILNEIPNDAVMYLINALDFDAKWQIKYEESDVRNYTFYNYIKDTSAVKMLFSNENVYLVDGEEAVGFAKAYKGGKYSFVGILPNAEDDYSSGDIYEYVNSLNGERWMEMWKNRHTQNVQVGFPEFTYQTDMLLNNALQSLGVVDMFDMQRADFSGISDLPGLHCDFIKQKTFIDVSRNGTKAAAITLGGMKDMVMSPEQLIRILLDRPFVYAIVDNTYGLPLFLGVVSNL